MMVIVLEFKNVNYFQLLNDIEWFVMDLKNLGVNNFSCNLYLEVFIKYFWRDQFVVVLIYIEGYSDIY